MGEELCTLWALSPKFHNRNIGPLFIGNLYGVNYLPSMPPIQIFKNELQNPYLLEIYPMIKFMYLMNPIHKFSKLKYRTPSYWKFIKGKNYVSLVPSPKTFKIEIQDPYFLEIYMGEKLCNPLTPSPNFQKQIIRPLFIENLSGEKFCTPWAPFPKFHN